MKTTIIAILLAFASIAAAQDNEWHERNTSCGYSNGHAWGEESVRSQLNYLIAVMEVEGVAGIGGKPTARIVNGFNIGEHREAMNRFFADPANGRIATIMAMTVVRMQFDGKPAADIDSYVRYLRSFYAVGSKCVVPETQQPTTKPTVRY